MAELNQKQRALADELIRTEWPKLERFLRTKVPPVQVQEIAQATFLGYVARFHSIHTDHKAYLWQIARFQVLKYYGRHRTGASTPFDSTTHTVTDLGPALSSVLDRRDRFVRALQALPADHQMAIELRYGEDLSLEQTAAALDVSLATAKRYLSAGEQALRQTLEADMTAVGAAYRGTNDGTAPK
jgi:RNA polymerase sigma factor (sigma-70 family)